MDVYETACELAGLDEKKVASIARRLERCGKDADALGLTIFSCSGSVQLRTKSDYDIGFFGEHYSARRAMVVAHIGAHNWDGGDGGTQTFAGEDDILYGE